MATGTLPLVTPAARFAAFAFEDANRGTGVAEAANSARYAEAFRHSYTDEAVAASVALIVAIANGDEDAILRASLKVTALTSAPRGWYR